MLFRWMEAEKKKVQSQHHLVFLIKFEYVFLWIQQNKRKLCTTKKKTRIICLYELVCHVGQNRLPLVDTNLSETCLIPWIGSFSRPPYSCGILCHIKWRRYCARAGIRRIRNMRGDTEREREGESRRKDIHN